MHPISIVRRVTVPSNVEAGASIEFDYYDVDRAERTPVIVLLPIFNGQLGITRYFARYFANQGWAAIVVVRERDALDGMFDPEEAIRANLMEYRRVLDWVEQQPEIDSGRIGLFGVSFGAMDAVMLTALDDRVDALVVAMAGGDLASLMMSTNYRRIVRRVDGMLEDSGMSREGFQETLARRITTDPLALAPYVDADRVLMIMTRTDAIVPLATQEALRAKMGAPETLYLPTGHRPSIVYLPKGSQRRVRVLLAPIRAEPDRVGSQLILQRRATALQRSACADEPGDMRAYARAMPSVLAIRSRKGARPAGSRRRSTRGS